MQCSSYVLGGLLAATLVASSLVGDSWAQTNSKEIMAREPQQLVELLQSEDSSAFDKAKACQRLAVVGDATAVPALVALLPDEQLNVYARFALEGIPDSAVDEALRQALGELEGRPLVGVISSIGQRRDAGALEELRGLLTHSESAVVEAALHAIGRIGTLEASGILRDAFAQDEERAGAVSEATLVCAEMLAAAGEKDEALELYQVVRSSNLPTHLQVAAIEGELRVLEGAEQAELLLEQIRSDEQAFFRLGLAAARRVPGAEMTELLTSEFETGKLEPERQAQLLLALGDREESVSIAVVQSAAESGSPAVREAAIQVLARHKDPAAAEVLLDAAMSGEAVAEVARRGLVTLESPELDKVIVSKLDSADAESKVVLLELVGARRTTLAKSGVRKAMEDSDPEVRLAAIAALGQLIELEELDLLLQPAVRAEPSDETRAARAALRMAALRTADREQCAELLDARLSEAPAAGQTYLLELLGEVSGQKALESVVARAKSADPELKDAATRVLGEWRNPDAAPALLEIARNDREPRYQIRALRGYLRIARQLQLPEEQRLEMYHTAMQVARRDDERRLAIDLLTRIPSDTTLQLAVDSLQRSELKPAAADAAVKIAGKLVAQHPGAVRQAMQAVLDSQVEGDLALRAQQLLGQAQSAQQ